MKGSKIFYGVYCATHGHEITKGMPSEVRVSRPETRREGVQGCPLCRHGKREVQNRG